MRAKSYKSSLYKKDNFCKSSPLMSYYLAADWIKISINLLMAFQVIVCLLLALVILMQRPKQEGLGAAFGGGLTDQAFGARTTDVLQKSTVYLGVLFFVISLVLAILIGKRQNTKLNMSSIVPEKTEQKGEAVPKESPKQKSKKAPITMPGDDGKKQKSNN